MVSVPEHSSYKRLYEAIVENCSELDGVKVKLGYAISDGPVCVLRNDKDVALMFKSQVLVGCDFIEVFINRDIEVSECSH